MVVIDIYMYRVFLNGLSTGVADRVLPKGSFVYMHIIFRSIIPLLYNSKSTLRPLLLLWNSGPGQFPVLVAQRGTLNPA